MVLMCRGPMGSGMEEIFEITAALRYLDFGKHVAVITDARFSGVSTGACIGHVTPEALAGGPHRQEFRRATRSRSSSTACGWRARSTW
jgi:dihydroxyacid dehydratase/phosphogluconate dehydratase